MDIPSLTFARTKFRLGYNQQEVDQFVDLITANLALPLAERTLGPSQVTAVCFTSTTFRAGLRHGRGRPCPGHAGHQTRPPVAI